MISAKASPAPRRTQKERSEESARRVLQATLELIAEKGFDRTSVAEIGRRAGYSRTIVHERYGSKAALLEAVLEQELAAWMIPETPPGENGLERALAHIDALQAMANTNPTALRAGHVICYETAGPLQELAPWAAAAVSRYRASIETELRAGQRDGSVRTDLDPVAGAHRMTRYIAGCTVEWSIDIGLIDLNEELPALRTWLAETWRPDRPGH